jgi:hypothetical protein
MKKFFLTLVAVAFVTVSANAQEGKWYGSKEGGFAITMNANPVLNYVGNMFNGTQNNKLEEFNGVDGFFNGTTITGKYFLKDNLALDLGLGINNNYNVSNNYNDANDQEKVTSYGRVATTAFQAKVGAEYRLFPGKRLQPLFGAALFYQHTNGWNFTKVTDGNNDGKTTYDNTANTNTTNVLTGNHNSKALSGGATNAVGLIFNVGVEYFIIPQLSFGVNLDLGVAKRWTKAAKENELTPDDKTENFSRISSKNITFATAKVGANVSMNFYF